MRILHILITYLIQREKEYDMSSEDILRVLRVNCPDLDEKLAWNYFNRQKFQITNKEVHTPQEIS